MLSAAVIIPETTDKSLIDSLQRIKGVEWNGFFSAQKISRNLENANLFSTADILPMLSDLVVILDPAYCTFEYLSDAIRKGCHLFLPEKFDLTIEEQKKLTSLAKEGNTLIQVRNDFIFQPLNKKILSSKCGTCFIDVHQTCLWEEGKLKEKISNNLLLVLLSCRVPFHRIDVFCGTGGVNHPDILNIHLNFINGSTVSITLSFVEKQLSHVMKIFHGKGINTFDLTKNSRPYYSLKNLSEDTDTSITQQIETFVKNIYKKTNPFFSISEKTEVNLLMGKIKEKLDLHFCGILNNEEG
jgi:hypothetical protein